MQTIVTDEGANKPEDNGPALSSGDDNMDTARRIENSIQKTPDPQQCKCAICIKNRIKKTPPPPSNVNNVLPMYCEKQRNVNYV